MVFNTVKVLYIIKSAESRSNSSTSRQNARARSSRAVRHWARMCCFYAVKTKGRVRARSRILVGATAAAPAEARAREPERY